MKLRISLALPCAHRWEWVSSRIEKGVEHNIYLCAKCHVVGDRDYLKHGDIDRGWDGSNFAPYYPPKFSYRWLKFRIWLYQRMGWPLDEEWYEG